MSHGGPLIDDHRMTKVDFAHSCVFTFIAIGTKRGRSRKGKVYNDGRSGPAVEVA